MKIVSASCHVSRYGGIPDEADRAKVAARARVRALDKGYSPLPQTARSVTIAKGKRALYLYMHTAGPDHEKQPPLPKGWRLTADEIIGTVEA